MPNILEKTVREIKRAVRKSKKLISLNVEKRDGESPFIQSRPYGKIYHPYYNSHVKILDEKPEIYNKDGRQMDTFFIRDCHGAHCPYNQSSKYFLWDRFNIALDTHFYTHNSMLETMGTPKEKYGYLVESQSIVPNDYLIFEKYKGLEKEFKAIFTYDEKILNSIENAKFFPSCAAPWYGNLLGDNKNIIIHDKVYEGKVKNISMMCSNKQMTEFHKIRHAFTHKALGLGVDVFGQFNGGTYLQYKSDSLEKYFYQIAIENGVESYYFTEKITDCFLAMTIPIYLGATKISEFFNPDGIITLDVKDLDNLDGVLKQCTKEAYMERLPAIIDNYHRALKYQNINDYLYETYFL